METIFNAVISSWGLTVVMSIVSLFLGKTVIKYRKLIKEIAEVGIKYRQITRDGSPGGKRMTRQEKDEFVKEIVDVLQAGASLVVQKKAKPIL